LKDEKEGSWLLLGDEEVALFYSFFLSDGWELKKKKKKKKKRGVAAHVRHSCWVK